MKLQPVSRQEFGNKRWQRYTGYGFAAAQTVSPLVLQELPKVMLSLPIAFMAAGTAEGEAPAFMPVAVQGLAQGQNLCVHPSGAWVAGYVPAALRSHPFYMASTPDGQQLLCFDADSSLLREDASGEAFFGDDGQPSAAVASVIQFLANLTAQRPVMQRACAALQAHGLIQPWTITLKTGEGEKSLQGLFRVDEEKLNQLDGAALHALQQAGALGLAYCQMLSQQHLSTLGRLAEQQVQWRSAAAQAAAAPALPTTASGELDLEFLNKGGTLHFGG